MSGVRGVRVYEEELAATLSQAVRTFLFERERGVFRESRENIQWLEEKLVNQITESVNRRFNLAETTTPPIILPTGTRFFRQFENSAMFLIEQPPMVRTLKFSGFGGYGNVFTYSLALPYVIFVFFTRADNQNIQVAKMAVRPSPLESFRDVLFCPPLPNVSPDDLHICLGDNYDYLAKPTIAGKIEAYIRDFWSYFFTTDYIEFMDRFFAKASIHNLEEWAEKTKESPLFILREPFTSFSSAENVCFSYPYPDPNAVQARDISRYVTDFVRSVQATFRESVDDFQLPETEVSTAKSILEGFLYESTESLRTEHSEKVQKVLSELADDIHRIGAEILARP